MRSVPAQHARVATRRNTHNNVEEDFDCHGAMPPSKVVRFDSLQRRFVDRNLVEQQCLVPYESRKEYTEQERTAYDGSAVDERRLSACAANEERVAD